MRANVRILHGVFRFAVIVAEPARPEIASYLAATFVHVVGVVEIVLASAVLTRYTRYAAYVVMVWPWCIALNLISQRAFLDIAVRGIEISLAAFTFAALSEGRAIQAGRVMLESNSGIAHRSPA